MENKYNRARMRREFCERYGLLGQIALTAFARVDPFEMRYPDIDYIWYARRFVKDFLETNWELAKVHGEEFSFRHLCEMVRASFGTNERVFGYAKPSDVTKIADAILHMLYHRRNSVRREFREREQVKLAIRNRTFVGMLASEN